MKTCLLNLPYPDRIMRRYPCIYCSSNYLLPPLELMYLGAIIKGRKNDGCILIDAIAERLNLNKVIKRLQIYQPDLLVFMAGIESFTKDIQTAIDIKSNFPTLKIACIGYLPTIFPKETLKCNSAVDYIIMNEPELSFSEIYDAFKERKSFRDLRGVAFRENGNIIVNEHRERIKDLDKIPFPDRELVNMNLYNEFLLKRPFTAILTSRGCPFKCTYCIPTYGGEIIFRSIENILDEIEEVIFKYKVKAIRFLDDTFTIDKDRVRGLCKLILKRSLKFQWSAMTRVGVLDKETLDLMKSAGLRRIYLGIETSSQRLLDYYQKGYNKNLIKEQVKMIKNNNIEAVGFFIVGLMQTEEDLRKDISLAKRLDLDYIVASYITPYPGTKLFEEMRDDIIFNLFPYMNIFKDKQLQKKGMSFAKSFYYSFYLNPHYVIKMLKFLFLYPQDLIRGVKRVYQFVFCYRNNQESDPKFI